MSTKNPWSQYWTASKVQNSFFSKNSDDEAEVNLYWEHFADQLTQEAKILDLATGNGIIPKILLDYKPGLHVVGVDQAHIDAEAFFKSKYASTQYEFQSGINICSLPFSDESFDGVTSQFGIEYAKNLYAYNEVARVLKPYGRFQFLLHHHESEPVLSSQSKLLEMEILSQNDGVMKNLKKFVRNEIGMDQLEAAAATVLNSSMLKTKQVTGQIFKSIDRIIEIYTNNRELAIHLEHDLSERLYAQYERLLQMIESAKNDTEMNEIVQQLKENGLNVTQMEAFYVGATTNRALVGWSLSGYK